MCAGVYETYFSVEHLSIAELQRRRANRRALPNANTVFTCDCMLDAEPRLRVTARREPRLQLSFPSHLAAPPADDPYTAAARSRAFARNSNRRCRVKISKYTFPESMAASDSHVFPLNYLKDSHRGSLYFVAASSVLFSRLNI